MTRKLSSPLLRRDYGALVVKPGIAGGSGPDWDKECVPGNSNVFSPAVATAQDSRPPSR